MKTSAGKKHFRSHSSFMKIWTVVSIVMLLLSVAPTLVNSVSAQADVAPPTDQPVDTVDEPTEVPTEPTQELPTEMPVDDTGQPTETPEDQLQEQPADLLELSTITINYAACPPGTDFATTDAMTLSGICVVPGAAASFTLAGTAGAIETQNAAAAPASLTFPGVPVETVSVTQSPAPVGGMAVFCEGNTSHGNTKPYAQALVVASQITLEVLEGEQIRCDWYVPAELVGGSLTLYKWICPPNVDPAVDTSECATEMPGVNFSLTDGNGTTPFTSDTNGRQLDGIVPDTNGVFTITEQIPPGYLMPVVYCQNNGEDPQPNQPTLVTVTNGAITIQPSTQPFEYQCFWYNVPNPDPSDIVIRKWTCPPGYDVMAPGVDPTTDCTQATDGITFVLSDTDPATVDIQTNTGDSMPGAVFFGGTNPGEVTITETVPAGIESVFLWGCEGFFTGGGAQGPLNTGPAYTFHVPGGLDITCDWYNVPSGEPGSVTIYKWTCEPGTLYGSTDPDYYPTQCATEMPGVDFTLTDGNGTTPFQSDTNGKQLDGVIPAADGTFTLTEIIPSGYGDPVVFCQNNSEDPQPNQPTLVTVTNGAVRIQPSTIPFEYQCFWYNIPETPGTVTIYKWECPQGVAVDPTFTAHQSTCTQPMDNVNFTLTDSLGPRTMTTIGGTVQWTDVQIETFTVTEEVPSGYSVQPYVFCDFDSQNNLPINYLVTNNVLSLTLNHSGQKIICHWFNQYMGPGEVTIYKWTCPEGYDVSVWGANPKNDCTASTNGINFVLDQPDPGVDLQTMTGDSIDGAVYFGGLTPGDYVVTEQVPAGIAQVFVLDCVGLNTGSVHPVPLSVGPTLAMKIAGGDKIRCDWYNVPQLDPQYGWMTVTKYNCTTPTYVSDIDCEVFEGGKTFDLQMWNGSNWVGSASGTTNPAGQLTWANLNPGTYRVVEQGDTACKVTSTPADANGNPVVNANADTAVKVYNCGKTPPPGGKMPTKYPNTGVDPAASTRVAPAASILAALGLLGTASISRRTFLRRSLVTTAAVGAGTLAVANGFASQVIQPIGTAVIGPEGTPAGTPGANCLYPATPSAATPIDGTPVACARGAVPVNIAIEAIGVDASIEVLEIVGGEMQPPTGATDVAWYKESARLGEQGNILLAGHLNYWGVPEGVFFALGQLKEGDLVDLTGDDDQTYRYIVQWTQDFPSDEEPPEEAVGQTAEQVITMITCGGEWITDRAEYDHRTLVRAIHESEYVPSSTPVATPGA